MIDVGGIETVQDVSRCDPAEGGRFHSGRIPFHGYTANLQESFPENGGRIQMLLDHRLILFLGL